MTPMCACVFRDHFFAAESGEPDGHEKNAMMVWLVVEP